LKRSLFSLRFYLILTAALSLIGAVLRSLSFLQFDRELGYFDQGAALPMLFSILTVTTLALTATLPLLVKDHTLPRERAKPSILLLSANGIAALAFALNLVRGTLIRGQFKVPVLVWLLGLAAMIGAIAYFVIGLLVDSPKSDTLVICGVCVILALACLLSFTYFDPYTQMNAPHKTTNHMALILLMLYTIYELRAVSGRMMPRALYTASLAAFFLCFTVGLSNLFAFTAGIYTDITYLAQDLLLLALSAYIGIRVVGDVKASSVTESESRV